MCRFQMAPSIHAMFRIPLQVQIRLNSLKMYCGCAFALWANWIWPPSDCLS